MSASRVEEAPDRPRARFGAVGEMGPLRPRPLAGWLFRSPLAIGGVATALGVYATTLLSSKHPRVAIAALSGVIVGVAILLEPGIGILSYFLLAFMRPQETLWGLGGTQLTQTVALFTLAATALHFAIRPSLKFLWRRQTIFLLTLWLFLHLSAHMNEFGSNQARWLDYYNNMFLMYFVTLALITSERWLMALAWVIAVSIGYLAFWANDKYFLEGWATVHGPGGRGATYRDENGFAMILVMVVPFLWYLMLRARRFIPRAVLFGTLVLAAHGVMVTFSRGGFLGLAACGGVIVLRLRPRWLAALVVVAGLGGFVAVTGPRYVGRMLSIGDFQHDKSATGRLDSWQAGLKMLAANPVFGVGLKRYVDEYHNYSNTYAREAHNSWVQLAAESGAIAVGSHIALVLLTGGAIFRVRRRLSLLPAPSRRDATALVGAYEAALAGFLVTGSFLSMEEFEFFYLLVAMVQILDRVTEKRAREEAPAGATAAAAA